MTAGSTARNPRLFVWFRVLFNSRFYYPVYAILFLDLGLSVEQFALLNAAWAATIVLLEVPSGALADQLGRRRLVVCSGVLMVLEMAVLCFTPAHSAWTFPLFLLNRILSGMGEAAASGADEALAYDSLELDGRTEAWRRLNARLIKWGSIGFVLAAITGSLLYDPGVVNAVLGWTGWDGGLTKETTLRFPLYLNLLTAFLTLGVAWRMVETHEPEKGEGWETLVRSTRNTLRAGAWIWRTPAAFSLILLAVCFDSIIRLFATLNSSFYRLIQIPEALFGFVGALTALVGIGSAAIGDKVIRSAGAAKAFGLVFLMTLAGCLGLAFPVVWWGLLFTMPLWLAMRLVHYFVSHYLNEVTPSARRATVLSFRGLAMNIGYGGVTLAYGGLTAWLDGRLGPTPPGVDRTQEVFADSLVYWAPWLLVTSLATWAVLRLRSRGGLDKAVAEARAEG